MHNQNQGFSLLELIIILIIVSILSVVPLYNWPGTVINLDAQAELFANDLRLTQSLSMAKTERYRLVRSSTTTYQILDSNGDPILFADGNTTETLNAKLSFGAWTNLTNNLVAFDGKGTPYLNTSGTALSFGTSYTIVITDGANSKQIGITPVTGRVFIQ